MSGNHVRQATFDTAPADSVCGASIRRGDIEFPVVDGSSSPKHRIHGASPRRTRNTSLLTRADERKQNGDDDDVPKLSKSMSNKLKSEESKRKRSPSPSRKRIRNEDKIADTKTVESRMATNSTSSTASHTASYIDTVPVLNEHNVQTSPPPRSHFMSTLSPSLARKIEKEKESSKPRIVVDYTGDKNNSDSKNSYKRGHVSPTPSRYEEISLPSRQAEKQNSDNKSDVVVPSFKSQTFSRRTLDSGHPDRMSVSQSIKESPSSENKTAQVKVSNTNKTVHKQTNRMETFENVRLERDGLLRAENAYKKRIRQLEEELKGFVKNIEELSDENRILREKSTDFSSAQQIKTGENRDLLERNQKLENENQNVWTENQQLKSTNDNYQSKISLLEKQNEKILTKLKELESVSAAKEKQLAIEKIKIENDFKILKSANEELELRVNSLKAENKSLGSCLDKTSEENRELQTTVQTDKGLREVLSKVEEELALVRSTNEKIVREIEELRNKNVTLEKEKSVVEKKVLDKDREISEKEKELNMREKQLTEQTDAHKELLAEKEKEIKIVKETLNKKKTSVADLQQQIQSLKSEIEKLRRENEELKKVKDNTEELKVKIKTLSEDLAKRTEINKKLKREKSDAKSEIDTLKKELELAITANQSETKHLKQLAQKECEASEQLKTELKDKQNEISKLETQLFEINMKVESQNEKMRELQREKKDMEVKVSQAAELEESNKNLLDDNRRLRQMLVERNIEVTNRKTEKNVLTSRLESLERKQKDSEIKVKQLQGWVSGALDVRDNNPVVLVTTSPTAGLLKGKSPHSLPVKRKKLQQARLRDDKAASYEDIRQSVPVDSPKPTPSLPSITDESLQTTIRPSYYQIYKQKMKLIKDRR